MERVCPECDTRTKAEWAVIAGGEKTRDYPLTRNQCVDVDRGGTPCCLVVISSTAHSAPAPALPWQRWIGQPGVKASRRAAGPLSMRRFISGKPSRKTGNGCPAQPRRCRSPSPSKEQYR